MDRAGCRSAAPNQQRRQAVRRRRHRAAAPHRRKQQQHRRPAAAARHPEGWQVQAVHRWAGAGRRSTAAFRAFLPCSAATCRSPSVLCLRPAVCGAPLPPYTLSPLHRLQIRSLQWSTRGRWTGCWAGRHPRRAIPCWCATARRRRLAGACITQSPCSGSGARLCALLLGCEQHNVLAKHTPHVVARHAGQIGCMLRRPSCMRP